MRLTRILAISLLVGLGTVPGIAQAPENFAPAPLTNPFATQPLPGSRIPAMDFHTQPGAVPRLGSRTMRLLNPFVFHPNDLYALQAPNAKVKLAAPATLMARNDGRCYALRDYQFSRVAPDSDATKLSGSMTCEPAGQVRLKGATAQAR